MPGPPTGTVTFLFTDIEGSTRLCEEQPFQMEAALRNCFANPLPTLEVAPQGVGVELFATFRLRTLAKSWR